MTALDYPRCVNCRYWDFTGCTYPRSSHRTLRMPVEVSPLSLCREWCSPDGESRRLRCRRINWAADDMVPPKVRSRRKVEP